MAPSLDVEEIMVIAVMHDYEARQRSYQLLAEAFEISSRVPKSAKV
jgi:hypothetical protein